MKNWLWLVPGVPAAALVYLIMIVLPPKQTLGDLGDWAFRLSPFVLAVVTVAVLPRWRAAPWLLVGATIVYMGFLDTGLVLRILAYGAVSPAEQDAAFQPIYQFQLLTVTFVVLFALLAYRMAGARTAAVLKAGFAAILVVISGLNDLTFWLTYDWQNGRPSELSWASHIIVFLGGPPSVTAAVIFMAVHLALAVGVLLLPLDRIAERWLARGHVAS
ncbi:hypothetical protein Aple_033820 [Acrocarpospora pleiomorpha]|uniref:Uncharacterized protein n=1 Tax=Acrocarpospora pleiomorpha TaxID=90975 RepID=A0A5M3XID7_9ACTN|nr:hypothetical protein [Acrocarpospora pleiomorpha]GES20486.1 hypothetical protein Aple_033820 [Acrocarpospora pleiomorpha]